jgi:hypothetical protein
MAEVTAKSTFKPMPMWEIQHEAMCKNLEVVVGAANQLQFDLDSQDDLTAFYCWLHRLHAHFVGQDLPRTEWRSKSGNWHIVIDLPIELTIPERIALQAIGHSDNGREFAALCCHWAGSPHPILLFKPRPKLLPATT